MSAQRTVICMMIFIKQLVCRHDWYKTRTVLKHRNRHYIVPMTEYKCDRCGKVAYRE